MSLQVLAPKNERRCNEAMRLGSMEVRPVIEDIGSAAGGCLLRTLVCVRPASQLWH